MQPSIYVARRPGWVAGFQLFVLRSNVLDSAADIIIGASSPVKTSQP